jgi:hypothetical protein
MHFSVLNAELYNLSFDLKWMIVCQVGYYSLIGGLVVVVICGRYFRNVSDGLNPTLTIFRVTIIHQRGRPIKTSKLVKIRTTIC